MEEEFKCKCGTNITKWATSGLCSGCSDQQTIDKAEKVEPDFPCCIVGTDTFFQDMEEAKEEFAGQWAHPCHSVPLHVDPKRTAESLAEQVEEWMCEDAFEDAYSCVEGRSTLIASFEAALIEFNKVQTASTWTPDIGKVFQIPSEAHEAAPQQISTYGAIDMGYEPTGEAR